MTAVAAETREHCVCVYINFHDGGCLYLQLLSAASAPGPVRGPPESLRKERERERDGERCQ